MKHKVIFCTLHALNFHNRSWKLFSLSLLLLLTLLISTLFTFHFYLEEMDEVKKEVYGPFHRIIYQNPEAFARDQEHSYSDELLQVCVDVKGHTVTIGYLTDSAYDLLFNGKVNPIEDDNICFLTTSIASVLNLGHEDGITIADEKLIVKHIIADYGDLWVRGMEEESSHFKPARILVSKHVFDALMASGTSSVRRIVFGGNNDSPSGIEYGNAYLNNRIERSPDQELYHSPGYFEYIAYGLVLLILIFLRIYYRKANSSRLHMLNRLGLSARDGGYLVGTELFVSVCVILILAVLSSFAMTSLFLSLLFSRPVIPEPVNWLMLSSKLFGIPFVFALILWIFYNPGIRAEILQKDYEKSLCHRSSLIASHFRVTEALSLVLSTVLFCFIAVFVYSYYHATNILISSVDGQGRFVSTYDFEVEVDNPAKNNLPMHAMINGKDHDNSEASSFFFYRPTPQNDLMPLLFQKLLKEQAVKEIYPYYEDQMIYLEIPAEHASDPYFFTKFIPETVLTRHPLFDAQVDFSRSALVQARLLGLPDPELKAMMASLDKSKYPDIDVEAVLEGKAAILVTPSYMFHEQETESKEGTKYTTRYITYTDSDSASAITQQALNNQSETVLWNLIARQRATYGSLSIDQAMEELMPQSHPLTIAVNVHENIAWFDSTDNEFPYRILVSNRYVESQQIASDYSRMRIYLNGNAAEDTNALQRIREILATGGSIQVVDQYLQMDMLHAYQQNQITMKLLWYALSVILFVFIGMGILNSHLDRNHSRYLILFRMGMRRSTVFWKMCRQAVLITLVSCLASALLYRLVFLRLTKIWVGMPLVWELRCIFLPIGISFLLLCLVIHIQLKRYLQEMILLSKPAHK